MSIIKYILPWKRIGGLSSKKLLQLPIFNTGSLHFVCIWYTWISVTTFNKITLMSQQHGSNFSDHAMSSVSSCIEYKLHW